MQRLFQRSVKSSRCGAEEGNRPGGLGRIVRVKLNVAKRQKSAVIPRVVQVTVRQRRRRPEDNGTRLVGVHRM